MSESDTVKTAKSPHSNKADTEPNKPNKSNKPTKPAKTKPTKTKPTKPAKTKPAGATKPTKPAKTKPAKTKPAKTKPTGATKPAKTKPTGATKPGKSVQINKVGIVGMVELVGQAKRANQADKTVKPAKPPKSAKTNTASHLDWTSIRQISRAALSNWCDADTANHIEDLVWRYACQPDCADQLDQFDQLDHKPSLLCLQYYRETICEVLDAPAASRAKLAQMTCFQPAVLEPDFEQAEPVNQPESNVYQTHLVPGLAALMSGKSDMPVCPTCQTDKFVVHTARQLRSGDEAMTVLAQCTKCKKVLARISG